MVKKFLSSILFSFVLVLLLFKLMEAEPSTIPGRIVVKLRPGVSGLSFKALLSHEVAVISEIPQLRVKVLSVPIGKEKAWLDRLRASPLIEYAEPARPVKALFTPNDPYWISQWNMRLIGAPQAWDITTGTSAITVAIIDTGVDLDHPEFSGRIVQGWDFVNNDPYPDDDHWHGTHVAGIAGAQGNNNQGIAGVAWNVKIMPLKVLDSQGHGYDYSVASAIVHAAYNGAKILNMSLGGEYSSQVLAEAVDYAYRKGCILVAAAGNGGVNKVLYPAAYTQVIAVSAVNYYSYVTSYSNRGPEIEVAAPGGDKDGYVLSTVPDKNYGYGIGTSMAAPHVAGLAALIWSVNPSLTAAQVRYCITSTAVDLGPPGHDPDYGYGVIDVKEAVKEALEPQLILIKPPRVLFLADASGFVGPSTATVSVENPGCVPITWVVGASPASWYSFSASGNPIFQDIRGSIRITATLPDTYGLYISQILVTGTALGGRVLTSVITVTLSYHERVFQVFLPLVLKQ